MQREPGSQAIYPDSFIVSREMNLGEKMSVLSSEVKLARLKG